jgi:aminoglycoside phosphotransferase (APT) family kinase protein
MYRVPVSGQPPGVTDTVVVRLAPHAAMGAKEAAVQRTVAAQGYRTPTVHVSEPDEHGRGWWSVMDFAAGAPLLAGLDGIAALRRAPSLIRSIPLQLAEAMSALHRLDPEPVESAIRDVAPTVASTTADVIEELRSGAVTVDRPDVLAALDHLAGRMPRATRRVVCHGDLHPFNVLAKPGGLVVLDWTSALVADPSYDVAYTDLLLRHPPLQLPGSLRHVGRLAGRLLSNGFLAAYRRADPNNRTLEDLDWYRALHCARVVIEVMILREAARTKGDPRFQLGPAAARTLSAFTSTDVYA